ncbi:MAG: DUF4838 domain-containing protein [Victivallales bacterium]|nr:DUF4838 domain-containing protein [Victivallales bacterium]
MGKEVGMKNALAVLCFCAAAVYAQTYGIVGPENPKAYESTAMNELRDYLAKRVKGDLTVGGKGGVTFHVGDTALAVEKGLASTSLPDEKWVVKSFGGDVVVNGGGTRGALYATYHFLEDCCDIHWWNDFEEHVPPASPLALPALDMEGRPFFMHREVYRTGVGSNGPVTLARNRLNSNISGGIPARLGGSFDFGAVKPHHTFFTYIPMEKYGKEHPEYFMMDKDGKRVASSLRTQLCLSNRDVQRIVMEKMLEFIKADREKAAGAKSPAPRIYDFSQDDNNDFCLCPECTAFSKEHGRSGLLVHFLTPICERLAKEYPELYVSTLAYEYTEAAPTGVKVPDNLLIRLCDTKSDPRRSIHDPRNGFFLKQLQTWGRIAKNLFVWDYAITYTGSTPELPLPGEKYLGDFYKVLAANNVSGVFWEHENEYKADMWELKFFLESKLMENPQADAAALTALFMDRYYGPAGKYILKARDVIDDAAKRSDKLITMSPKLGDFDYLTDGDVTACLELFRQAEEAVKDDPTLVMRVHRAQLGIDLLICYRSQSVPHYGGKAAEKGVSADASVKRIQKSWTAWVKHYAGSQNMVHEVESTIQPFVGKFTPPKELAGRSFYYLMAGMYSNFDSRNLQIVDDAAASTGSAMRIRAAGNDRYSLPLQFGAYDRALRKDLGGATVEKAPENRGYNLFRLGEVHVAERTVVWINRSWTIQCEAMQPVLCNRTFDVYVTIRFEGPMFYGDQKGESYIYSDAIYFVEH